MPPRAALIANGIELALVCVGLATAWALVFSPAGRARRHGLQPAIVPWAAPLSEFMLFLWLAVCGGIAAQLGATAILRWRHFSSDAQLIIANAALEFGLLAGIGIFRVRYATAEPRADLPVGGVLRSGLATFSSRCRSWLAWVWSGRRSSRPAACRLSVRT
jgi:hypothetical protein